MLVSVHGSVKPKGAPGAGAHEDSVWGVENRFAEQIFLF
jgi:hypothetical protein